MPEFKPGQYTALGYKPDDIKSTRAYSICSVEEDPFWEFLITVVEAGDVSRKLAALNPGDSVYYKDTPKGSMTLDRIQPNAKTVVFIATGSGVGPFKPMIRSILHKPDLKTVLIQGSRRVADLHYFRFFLDLSSRFPNFEYIPFVSRESTVEDMIKLGRVTDALSKGKFDPMTTMVYVCGNPEMVSDVKKFFEAEGFQTGQGGNIVTESYW